MIEIELENCCRTCLRDTKQHQQEQMKLLSTMWNTTLSFADMLMDILKISLSDDTILKICNSCELDLITAYNFNIVCRNTEQVLMNTRIMQPKPIEEIKIESYKHDQCPEILLTEENERLDTDEDHTNDNIKKETDLDDIGGDNWQDLCEVDITVKKPKKRGRKPKAKSYETFDDSLTNQITEEYKQTNDVNDDNMPIEDDVNKSIKVAKKRKKYERKKPIKNKDSADEPPKEKKKRVRNPNNLQIKPACKYCKRCDIKFESNQVYMQHVKEVHWVASPCTFCGKLFFPCHMETHMISHSKEKNHICSLCGSRFSYEYNLKSHMRIHSGEKRYKCDFCDETFIHWNSKKNHMYLKHTREKKYECYICHKRFGQNGGMKTHIRYHTGDLPHFCPFCQKRFPSPYKLRRHIKTHREIPAEHLAPHLQLINPPIINS